MQKKTIGKLSPDKDVAKRVLSGKEKIFKFDNAKDAIKSLEDSTSINCGRSSTLKLFKNNTQLDIDF